MKNRDASELVNIGRIGSSVGLRGEVRVTLYASDSDNLKEGKVLLLKRAGRSGSGQGRTAGAGSRSEISAVCRGVRQQNGRPVIRLEGIDDRNAADELRNMEIYIQADDLEELPKGEHYVRDLVGCTVRDIASGTEIGTLKDVIQNTAQSVLDIRTAEDKQILIPAVDAFLRRIDEDEGIIEVELIPGFID